MTNTEIIKNLSLKLGQPQDEIKRLLKVSTDIIIENLDKDFRITLPGLGTFGSKLSNRRRAYDPFHKRLVLLPPKRKIRFRPGIALKSEIRTERL